MRLLLLTVFSLLASCGTLISSSQQVSSPSSFDVGRSLSTTRSNGAEDKTALRASKPTVSEERGIEALKKWGATTYWINNNITPAEIKKILNQDGLSGADVKSAQQKWVSNQISTGDVWKTMELDNIPKKLLKNDPGFKMYVQYLNIYDNKMMKLKDNDAIAKLGFGASAAEKAAKVDIWIKENRPNWYVQSVLNLDQRGYKSFRKSENYPYYQRYKTGIDENRMKEWLASGVATENVWELYIVGRLSGNSLKRSEDYQTYVQYALKYDDKMFDSYKNGNEVKVSSNSIADEMKVRVELWAKMGRPNEYVRKMLGMDENALKESPNYGYYAKFLEQKK